MTEKILIVGNGFLGSNIFSSSVAHNIKPIVASRSEHNFLDVTQKHSIEKIVFEYKPDFIINCAALTKIDDIEIEPKKAFKINAYVHPDRAAYLKKLAKDNSRKISAQLDLILREHEAANG